MGIGDKIDYIKFEREQIKWKFTSLVKDDGGKSIAYIPSFNVFVSGNSHEDVRNKAKLMIRHLIQYYIKEEGWKNFILFIHKLGFKVPGGHNSAMHKFLNGKRPNKTDFNYAIPEAKPVNFADAIVSEEEHELAL